MLGTKRKSVSNQSASSRQQKRVTTIRTKWNYSKATKSMKKNFDDGRDNHVINETKNIIENLQTEISLLLELQAWSYGRKGQHNEEIQAAIYMMTFAPQDATGYLLAGRRYIYQGYQKRAMDVLDKGLEQVPQTHPDYNILLQEKNQTQKRLDHRIDFLNRLPFDITCRIIKYIPKDTIIQCSRVSSAWRTLILNDPLLWRCMDTATYFEINSIPLYLLLPSVSRHVEVFHGLPERNAKKILCLKFLQTLDFPNLHQLHIGRNIFPLDIHGYYTLLCVALINVSGSLKSLSVTCTDRDGIPNVSHILSICRNLTSLRFTTFGYEMNRGVGPFNISYSTNLTKIELFAQDEKITGEDIQKLLQSSPNIRWLSILNCDTNYVFKLVQEYCTKIKGLSIGLRYQQWEESDEWYADIDHNSGLQAITVAVDMIGPGFIALLEKNCTKLRKLTFEASIYLNETQERDAFDFMDWQQASTLDYSNMTYFHLCRSVHDTTRHHIGQMLKHMPNLKNLILKEIDDELPPSVFKNIKEMHQLSELQIIDCIYNRFDLHRLLKAFAQNNTKSSALHSLELKIGSLDGTAMEICGKIESLKKLVISFETNPPRSSVNRFVKYVSQLPHLEHLYLKHMDMTSEDLQAISTIKLLDFVEFEGIRGINWEELDDIFSSNVDVNFNPYTDDDDDDSSFEFFNLRED